jgi:hypothetical protein
MQSHTDLDEKESESDAGEKQIFMLTDHDYGTLKE